MKNPFQELIERQRRAKQHEVEEQRMRKERLRELEAAQSTKKGLHIPHPIQASRDKKEMRSLKNEITAYEEKQKNKKVVVGGVAVLVGLFTFIGIMAVIERNTTDTESAMENVSIENIIEQSELTEEEQIESTTIATIVSNQKEEANVIEKNEPAELKPEDAIVTQPANITHEGENEELPEDLIACSASQLRVNTLTDYAHINSDIIHLGNAEGVTVTVIAPLSEMTYDDLFVLYDEKMVNIEFENPVDTDGKTSFNLYATGMNAGTSEILITTEYEVYSNGEDASAFVLSIDKMDSTDGRVCFVTTGGEKYHYSASCAGENAVKTTYRDATAYDYEPCGKCVK